MPATLIHNDRLELDDGRRIEIVVWELSEPMPGCTHRFKYRLALVASGKCVLRYDNERGKGDHKHLGKREVPYTFTDLKRLSADFFADVRQL